MSQNQVTRFMVTTFLLLPLSTISAATASADETGANESPWLFTPLVSSAPKFGTSIGAMGAYLHAFDEESPTSTFGLMAQYSNSESLMGAAFGRTYFDHDRQRLIAGSFFGEINNEYSDFQGIGYPVNTTDNIHALFVRYTYRLTDNWFFGPQIISTDYAITGNDWFSQQVLALVGLTGFDSNGLGLVAERDTRDNQNSPSNGSLMNINNIAYRKSFGGDTSFDAYTLKYSTFFAHGNGHVLAARVDGRWTHNAPPGGYSSIRLRGYTMGQELAPHATLMEVEERHHFKGRWGSTAFIGAECLYGDDRSCDESENWFPSIGGGITFSLKPEEKMIARTEIAIGKGENQGFYMKFGYQF